MYTLSQNNYKVKNFIKYFFVHEKLLFSTVELAKVTIVLKFEQYFSSIIVFYFVKILIALTRGTPGMRVLDFPTLVGNISF